MEFFPLHGNSRLTGQFADIETHGQSIRRLVNSQTRRVMHFSIRGLVNSVNVLRKNGII